MIRMLTRFLRRLAVVGLGALSVWLIVFVIFRFADHQLHWMTATAITYAIAAYVILPRTVIVSLKILQRRHVPRYTITADGLPGDPVNVVFAGTLPQLRAAFDKAGWSEADPLNLTTSCRMVRAFVLNSSYPSAPFSTLFLFGRGQDIGFQKAIGDSPRKRHHIRFWALGMTRAHTTLGTADLWLKSHRPPDHEHVYWVGAGTRDTGFSLTRLTFQITHATDSDTNIERDFIIQELKQYGLIGGITPYQARQQLPAKQVNHYITDGEVVAAVLAVDV